tara:strand:+ start:401 stop:1240 length:840 start_codon:yes stop_codon:yes gene_type:complete
MKTITLKISVITIIFLMSNYLALGQCANTSNIYSFVYNGKTYEVIKENKTWVDAAFCAVERGGILTEINDVAEQNAIYTELNTNAGITVNNTVAPDGGGGSYVWIGGNDLSIEGNWVWDGNNDNNSTQFWMGTSTGNPVGGLYNNWGNEPDDFGGQDALGLSLNGWPLGSASQWNDVDHTNTLYYVVEHSTILSIGDIDFNNKIKLFPNPVVDFLTIKTNGIDLRDILIFNTLGQKLITINLEEYSTSKQIDLSILNDGVYFVRIRSKKGNSTIKKIVK